MICGIISQKRERFLRGFARTGIALMGFGFVAARFGLFADEPDIMQYASGVRAHGLSLWFGTALVVIGVAVNLFSARRYMRLVSELNSGQFVRRSSSKEAVIVGHVAGVARHSHADLPDLVPGAAA